MKAVNLKQRTEVNEQSHGLPSVLPTKQAAPFINRQAQTMRKWACLDCGPIKPIRINGRLHWRVSDLKTLLEGGQYDV
jgi:hypothetical protein